MRMFSGTVHTRDRLHGALPTMIAAREVEGKVTAISVFDNGAWVRRGPVCAGEIGKLWGLGEIRVGDAIGRPATTPGQPTTSPRRRWRRSSLPAAPATRVRFGSRSRSSPSRTR